MIRLRSLCAPTVLALLATASLADAAPIMPTHYDMPNGQQAAFSYYDQSYSGDGDLTTNLAPLTNGLGDLTDGIIPTQGWNVTPAPYVGWLTINPTIRFHFDASVQKISQALFYFDDSEGTGGVIAPSSIELTDGTTTKTVPIADSPAAGRFFVAANDLDFTGPWIDVTITKTDGQWMMMSEARFEGELVPEVGSGAALLLSAAAGCVVRRSVRRRN